LPVVSRLTRPIDDIRASAGRVRPAVATAMADTATVEVVACTSQIGSGALPTRTIPSAGLSIRPLARRGAGRALRQIAGALRSLPVPVLGRIDDDAIVLDLRCLDDEATFLDQLHALR
jgi:L-seryl-tRNA(Ser) seleniumtransferase